MNEKQDTEQHTEPNEIPQYAESNETPITEHEVKQKGKLADLITWRTMQRSMAEVTEIF